MAFARDVYTASAAQTDFTITFPYQDAVDVLVYEDGVLQTVGAANDYTLPNATTVRFNAGLVGGEVIVVQRSTSQSARTVDYTAGALAEADLDNDSIQAFYMAQEAIDIANTALGLDVADEWDALSKPINNVTDPTDDQDAATKKFVDDSIASAVLGSLTTPISIANGGTAGATAGAALTNLGLTAFIQTLIDDATAAAARTTLGVVIGTDVAAEGGAGDPFDIPFIAGYDPDFTVADLVVQTYGEIVVGRAGSFTGEVGYLETVATGAAVIVDIEKNGTTIYTTKPQFAVSSTALTAGTLKTDGTEDFVSGDRITFKVTQIGSTIAGGRMRFTGKASLS